MQKADGRMLKPNPHLQSSVRTRWDDVRLRLDTVAQQNPEWRAWLALLEETLRVLDEPVWTDVTLRLGNNRPATAPLLDGGRLTIDARKAHNWIRSLTQMAAKDRPKATSLAGVDLNRLDALGLLEAAIGQDYPRLAVLADGLGADPPTLDAVAQLAAMPLLQACGRQLAGQAPAVWPYGYCPVCGAWPTLVEVRGLERTRRLRCARCGGDWESSWLRCPYCGEADHQRLGFLLPAGTDETCKVETCTTCKGYVKALTTLQGSPPYAVILEDLATVDFDIVALERGYTRPKRPGYTMKVQLVESPSRWRVFLNRNA